LSRTARNIETPDSLCFIAVSIAALSFMSAWGKWYMPSVLALALNASTIAASFSNLLSES
jgi:hypothetical protein